MLCDLSRIPGTYVKVEGKIHFKIILFSPYTHPQTDRQTDTPSQNHAKVCISQTHTYAYPQTDTYTHIPSHNHTKVCISQTQRQTDTFTKQNRNKGLDNVKQPALLVVIRSQPFMCLRCLQTHRSQLCFPLTHNFPLQSAHRKEPFGPDWLTGRCCDCLFKSPALQSPLPDKLLLQNHQEAERP